MSSVELSPACTFVAGEIKPKKADGISIDDLPGGDSGVLCSSEVFLSLPFLTYIQRDLGKSEPKLS
ncbi:MAG: hypothetical protein M0019_09605 [Actinomycetota bacterium]|nr:hypothetical protein [Actinomycetota bacterium]